MLAGDAFSTIKQESLASVITQNEEISGLPAYLTTDWQQAEKPVKHLKDLDPALAIPSHGQPMQGEKLKHHLQMLAQHFEEMVVPKQGKFINKE